MSANHVRILFLSAALLCLFMPGCTPQPQWTHATAGKFQLALDRKDCGEIAHTRAQEASRFGRREVWGLWEPAFEECMQSRGWRMAVEKTDHETPEDASATGEEHLLFSPPEGFHPDPTFRAKSVSGAMLWQGPNGQSLFMVRQHSAHGFTNIAPPLHRPYYAYDRQSLFLDGCSLRMLVYFGRENGRMVGGVSAYVLDEQGPAPLRTVIVASGPLPAQAGQPPPGCRLDSGQKKALEEKAREWRIWMVGNMKGNSEKSR